MTSQVVPLSALTMAGLSQLQRHALLALEARARLGLLWATAGELGDDMATAAGTARRAVLVLANRGLAEVLPGRPQRFRAATSVEVLARPTVVVPKRERPRSAREETESWRDW